MNLEGQICVIMLSTELEMPTVLHSEGFIFVRKRLESAIWDIKGWDERNEDSLRSILATLTDKCGPTID